MKKKIYTLILIFFTTFLLLYILWTFAANIQKEAFKRHLRDDWSINLSNEKITTNGFPFKFGLNILEFNFPIKYSRLTLQFLKLEIVRLIYNFSDVILFVEKPLITSMDYPKLISSADKLKVSISDKPFSGRFRLITELEDWKISDDKNFKRIDAKKIIFALRDVDAEKLDFYFKAYDLGLSFFDKVQKKTPEKPNELILKGNVSNISIYKKGAPNQAIGLPSIMLEELNMKIGSFKLSCNDAVTMNLLELTTEGDVDCLFKLKFQDISKINAQNEEIQSVIDLINLILIIKHPKMTAETQVIPLKFRLKKGLFYVNGIPIYQFSKKN